jgi:hypothetical protein
MGHATMIPVRMHVMGAWNVAHCNAISQIAMQRETANASEQNANA